MIEYVPATEKVAKAYEIIMHGWHEDGSGYTTEKEALEEFHRWLAKVKAKAWDEGFADGVNHDLGDWENAPSIINNPYRQGQEA